MSIDDYKNAQKAGVAEYRICLLRGKYPYLPILEESIQASDIESVTNLGLVQIPAKWIVGTYTAARRTSFAPNFMPLLDAKTEFATKWTALLDAHLSDGIRDPIKAYEYMNKFYVIEGNKRVSVLKYCDAVAIAGEVIRLVPKRTEEKENKIYFEFIDFYRHTGVNYVWFTQEGSFAKMLLHVTGGEDRDWTDEEKTDFHSVYTRFSNAFREKGGKKLAITTGDALLTYLDIYSYETALTKMADDFKNDLTLMWNEVVMLTEEHNVALVLDPEEEQKKNLFSRILSPSGPQSLKITFINGKSPETSGWTYAHELGRMHLEEKFGSRVQTEVINNVSDDGTAEQIISDAVNSGSNLIFTTTPLLLAPSLKVAIENPKAIILNCSVNISHRYVRTYYSRLYEAKFLTGMIAGALSENGRIGYVADYPIYGMTSNINAFALGAAMVNPRARIYLDWSTREDYDEMEFLKKTGVSHVSMHDMVTPKNPSRKFGLYSLEHQEPLAMPIRDWGRLYELLVDAIFRGDFNSEDGKVGQKALNYLWGMSAGVVDLVYSRRLPIATAHMVDFMKSCIKNGSFLPFSGPIYTTDGTRVCGKNQSLTPEQIVQMDWLAENVIGEIPSRSELIPEAQKIVDILGLKPDTPIV